MSRRGTARARLAGAVVLTAALGGCGEQRAPGGPVVEARDGAPRPLDPEAVEALEAERIAVIEKAMNDLAAVAPQCWAAGAVDDYQLAGAVTLLISVDDGGRGRAEVRADSARDPVLTGCLVAIAEAYQWPASMVGEATQLPFAFTAPAGQNLIDRRFIPEIEAGARVLLDGRNSGNRAASMFELVIPAGQQLAATASQRSEVWVLLDAAGAGSVPAGQPLDAFYLPPGAVRSPAAPADAPLRILIVAVPGGDEDATRRSGVLPASPADRRDKKAPRPIAGGGPAIARPGVGEVTILIEPARAGGDALSASRLDITEAGATIDAHVHDASTELLYVLSGGGTMIVDGVELAVTATSVVQIPAGIEHAFTADAPTRAIQLYTPAGPEQRFRPAAKKK